MHLHHKRGLKKLQDSIWEGNFENQRNFFRHWKFACYFSAYDYVVPARGKAIVKTDIQIELPEGCYGRIAPRSGLAAKNFIDIGGKKNNFPPKL
jgi:hypothetical protein